ncbi:amino acid permease [Actinomadura harenae]|uniref:Amino acid permease n=1 Tax=Actinomadura harenae TaxID=2483351 RepID=A0A3M2M2S3_9ACTN|nr:amino acid permease [Actinomadura harenae]RMI43941.1 amino acid permease [Actinomadura harenae]
MNGGDATQRTRQAFQPEHRSPAGDGERAEADTTLPRRLTSRQLSMITLGGAIGTGLFLGTSRAISQAGPAVIISYAIGALLALALAYALAEMASAHPLPGGFGTLAHAYLGSTAAFTQRWMYWMAQTINVGSEVTAISIYLRFWWPHVPAWLPVLTVSAFVLGVNLLAVGAFGEVEYWLSVGKVLAILTFIVTGTIVITVGLPTVPATGLHRWTDQGGFAPQGIGGIWTAMIAVTFSYMGTEAIALTAAESRDPARDIPRAARRTVVRLGLFYLLTIAVILSVDSWRHTAAGPSVTDSPFVRLFQTVGLPAAASVMNLVLLVAAVSAMNTNIYVTTRTMHGMANSGHAPRALARLRHGRPWNALAVSAFGLALAATMSAFAPVRAFEILVGISLFNALATWILIFATHIAFRRRGGGVVGTPTRLRGGVAIPLAAIGVLLAVLVTMGFVPPFRLAPLTGVPFLVALLLVHLILHRRRGRMPESQPDRT